MKAINYTTLHPFNGLFPRTACASRYQKGRTVRYFTEERDDGVAVASAGQYAINLHLASNMMTCHEFTAQILQAGCPI